jgi:hypothetical protein
MRMPRGIRRRDAGRRAGPRTTGGATYDAGAIARPWLLPDALRWADTRPPRWARPVWPALLLAVAVVSALAMSSDPVCTAQVPCGDQWPDAVGTMLVLPHLLSLFVLPELVLLTAPLLLLYSADPAEWEGGAGEKAAVAVLAAALCWCWLSAAARLRTRRAQRTLIREAAGGLTAPAALPEGVRAWQRGLIRCLGGALMCGAAAVLIGVVVAEDHADDRTARTAVAHEVPVVSYSADDYTLTVRMPGGARRRFDVNGTYENIDTVRVLVRGDWVRLASEPRRDHTGLQAAALALAGLGVVAMVSGGLGRLRVRALLRGPVPVLRARAATRAGVTEVFADDDLAGVHPIMHFHTYGDGRAALHPVVLYGPAGDGGVLALSTADGTGRALFDLSLSPIGRGAPPPDAVGAGAPRPGSLAGRRDAVHDRLAEARARQTMADMAPAAGPVRWHAGPAARCGAALILCGAAAMVAAIGMFPVSWLRLPVVGVAACFWSGSAWRLSSWQILADADGLRIGSRRSARRIPWESVTGARYDRRGVLTVTCGQGARGDIRVGTLGWPYGERLRGRPGRAARAAAEITAMAREPGLRPGRLPD